jgi:hypothetical protein
VWDRAAQDRGQPRVRSCSLGGGREEVQEGGLFATGQQGRVFREELVGVEAAGGEGVRKRPLHRHENVCEIQRLRSSSNRNDRYGDKRSGTRFRTQKDWLKVPATRCRGSEQDKTSKRFPNKHSSHRLCAAAPKRQAIRERSQTHSRQRDTEKAIKYRSRQQKL